MFKIFNRKNLQKPDTCLFLNEIYDKLQNKYSQEVISDKRRQYLEETLNKYGYLPYPYIKALEELSASEILFALEKKWEANGTFKDGKFKFKNNEISVLSRNNIKNSDWLKKEGHNIKLINLAGLGNGNETKEPGKFMDWLRQLLILPTGNLENNIFNTTIYLIPFHPREFGCAYLPKSSDVSENLLDKDIEELTGMDAKTQVKTFITLAQLAGHPVIYDILPQTGRFSKAVLANPSIARWFDIKELDNLIKAKVDEIGEKLSETADTDDVQLVKDMVINGTSGDLTEYYQNLYDDFNRELDVLKKDLSDKMLQKSSQDKIHKRSREIIQKIHGFKNSKQINEHDITKQIESIQALISEGLWPAPGGAWCSAGVPVYDKMSECGGYPTFKHYDYKGDDVTNFANLDCQTPYYFVYLENGKYNEPVIKFFVDYMQKLQEEYNFDGFRVDHIDHVVDTVSEKNGVPISYRAPREVLNRLNTEMKKKIPHFATLAEYMLWDGFLKEYHEGMNFDVLWGNDIISQFEKTPEKIVEDNQNLTNYNSNKKNNYLSILKTYNNQDGEFRCIDQYPGQLQAQGALYKWFKYKFLPGGKYAQRPVLYVDGDESYTKRGIESVIGDEISMPREKDYDFFAKFDAIDRFVKSQNIITDGEAQIITQEEDGFAAWLITKEPMKKAFLAVSNYKYPVEKVNICKDGESFSEWVEGSEIKDKKVTLPSDFNISGEWVFDKDTFVKKNINCPNNTLSFNSLTNGEFRIFELSKNHY